MPGELYIGGAGVARGYLGRPELTAERFVPDPFGGEPGARLYRTGDLGAVACRTATLEYLGRIDHQVKIRGFRIELGEIEARAARAPGGARGGGGRRARTRRATGGWWRTCVGDGGRRGGGAARAPGASGCRSTWCRRRSCALEALPLTPNGKVDRRALPAPEGDAYARRGYEAPRAPVEEALAEIWAEVLGVERVGRHDDFFELGGHSLLAMQVVSRRAAGAGRRAAAARRCSSRPVLAELARGARRAARGAAAAADRAAAARERALPLSFAQQRLWFLDQLAAGRARLQHPRARCGCAARWTVAALRRALDRIVRRHEALRTTFVGGGRRAGAGDRARDARLRAWSSTTCAAGERGARSAAAA